MTVRKKRHKERGEGQNRNKRARLEANRGEKRDMGRQRSPRSANKNWDQVVMRKRIHLRKREANSTCVWG